MSLVIITGNRRKLMEDCGELDLQFDKKLLGTTKAETLNDFLTDSSYPKSINQIVIDIGRTFFMPSNNKRFNDFIHSWTSELNYTPYIQGDMDGRISTVLKNYITHDPRFLTDHLDCTTKNGKNYEYLNDITDLSFGYFDDDGIPCALNISCLKSDPSLWTLTLVRHATSDAELKEVTLIAPEKLIYRAQSSNALTSIEPKNIQKQMASLINSVDLVKKLSGIVADDGRINPDRLTVLQQNCVHGSTEKLVKTTKDKFVTIYSDFCEQSAKNWDQRPIDEINENFQNYLLDSIKVNETIDSQTVQDLESLLSDYHSFKKRQLHDKLIIISQKLINAHIELNQKGLETLAVPIDTLMQLTESMEDKDFDSKLASFANDLKQDADALLGKIPPDLQHDLVEFANNLKQLTSYKNSDYHVQKERIDEAIITKQETYPLRENASLEEKQNNDGKNITADFKKMNNDMKQQAQDGYEKSQAVERFPVENKALKKEEITPIISMNIASDALKEALTNPAILNNSALQEAGSKILQIAKDASEEVDVSEKHQFQLTQCLNSATEVIKDPTNVEKIQHLQKNTEEALAMNSPWLQLMAGAMLGLLGVAVIGISIVLAVGTFGGATPVSAAGLAIGGSMIGAGFAVGIGMAAGLGITVGAGILANDAIKENRAMAVDVKEDAGMEKRLSI